MNEEIRLSFPLSRLMKGLAMSDSLEKNQGDDAVVPTPGKQQGLFNKSLATNLTALLCVGAGYLMKEPAGPVVLNVGLFAFSGALTNWLAIHMLFEKVPGFYGSGVIPARFEDFKGGIHQLIMQQFFTHENITRFFEGDSGKVADGVDLDPLIQSMDLNPAFEALKTAVLESKFGATLAMFGGAAALEPMKPGFEEKMRVAISEIAASETRNRAASTSNAGANAASVMPARAPDTAPPGWCQSWASE